MTRTRLALLILYPFLLTALAAAEESATVTAEVQRARAADSEAELHEIRQMIRRLFEGGGYAQVIEVGDALLDNPAFRSLPPPHEPAGVKSKKDGKEVTLPPSPEALLAYQQAVDARNQRQFNREWVWFFRARAEYEAGLEKKDRQQLARAAHQLRLLGENRRGFRNAQFRPQAHYWAGKAYAALSEWTAAIEQYREIAKMEPDADLDVKTSLALSEALEVQASRLELSGIQRSPRENPRSPEELAKARNDFLRAAVTELTKISAAYQQSEHREEAELRLMQLYLRTKQYGEMQKLTEAFLKRVPPSDPAYAKAAYYQAQSAYWQGKIQEASRLYREALNTQPEDSEALIDLLYGYGWTNARLAQTASPEKRLIYLQRAQNSLRRALRRMQFNDNRRLSAILTFVEVLIDLGEYTEALLEVRKIIDSAPATASYYAGIAARGVGDPALAQRYFARVIRESRGRGDPRRELDALFALATLAEDVGDAGRALAYYRDAESLAVRLRNYSQVASARLGVARNLIGLGRPDPAKSQQATAEAGLALLDLLGVTQSENPNALEGRTAALRRRLRVVESWQTADTANFQRAETLIRQLEGRLAAHLRKDEIDFVKGLAFLAQAEEMRASMPITPESREGDYQPVFELYKQAVANFATALTTNPRGDLSSRISFALGRTHYLTGSLADALADLLRQQERGADSVVFQQQAAKAYKEAERPLRFTERNARPGSQVRIQARKLRGDTLFALGAYREGLIVFRALANDTNLSQSERFSAMRKWAKALAEVGQQEEAVRKLLVFNERDLAASIQAARLLLDLRQPRRAFASLQGGLQAAGDREPRTLLAEAGYWVNRIGLLHSESIFRIPEQQASLRDTARQSLWQLVETYPETEWAARAVKSAGESLITENRWKDAQTEATRLQSQLQAKHLPDLTPTLQALDILEGLALQAEAKQSADPALYRQAISAFQRAEAQQPESAYGQALRARAVRLQGVVYEDMGDWENALRLYRRVFSLYHQKKQESDLARIAAAAIYAKQKNYDLAVRILEEGADQNLLRETRLEYESKRREQEDG